MSSFQDQPSSATPEDATKQVRLRLINAKISPEPFAEAADPAPRPRKRGLDEEDEDIVTKFKKQEQAKTPIMRCNVGESWERVKMLLQDNRKVCVDFHKLIALGAPESPFSGAPTPVSTNCSSDNDDDDDDDDNDSVGELRELAGLDINDPALDIFAFDESLFEPPLRVKSLRQESAPPVLPVASVSTIDVYRSMRQQGFVQETHFMDQSKVFVAADKKRLKTVRKSKEPLSVEGGVFEIVASLQAMDEQGQPSTREISVSVSGKKILEQMQSSGQHVNWHGIKKEEDNAFFGVIVFEISKTLDTPCTCNFGSHSSSTAVVSPTGEGDFKYDINVYYQTAKMRDAPSGVNEPYIHYVFTNEFGQRVASWQEYE